LPSSCLCFPSALARKREREREILKTHPAVAAVVVATGVLSHPSRWIHGVALASLRRSRCGSSRMGSFVR
jgi:hypothetical protein